MLYLIDANVLIRADADYYPVDRIPPFWHWLYEEAFGGHIKMPFEIFTEVTPTGSLKEWLDDDEVQAALILDEQVDQDLLNRVLDDGYAPDLTDDEVEQIGRDPFLAAYALADMDARAVVTKETPKPGKQRANRTLPDVCDDLRVMWMDDFELYRRRDFRINR